MTRVLRHATCWGDLGFFGSGFKYGFVPSALAWTTTLKFMKLAYGDYPTTPGMTTVFTRPDNSIVCLVTAAEHTDKRSFDRLNTISILAHEAVHVFQELCIKIGEKEPSCEFEAYMIQHIFADLTQSYCATRTPLFGRT